MKSTMTRINEEDLNLLDELGKKLNLNTRTKVLNYVLNRVNADLINEEAYHAAMEDEYREQRRQTLINNMINNHKELDDILDPRD